MFKEKLLRQIIALGGKSYTLTELANRLNFRSSMERKVLEKTLSEMLRDGSIMKAGRGKYSLASQQNLLKGELQGNKRGFAFLIREDKGPDLFVPNKALSGALHGDTVLVRKTGESEGQVVTIVKRGAGKLVGTYILSGSFGFVVPDDDNYFKDIYIPFDKTMGAEPMSKVVVSFRIDLKTEKPVGEITEILGKAGERDAEVLSILKNYNFSEKFPEEVLRASEAVEYKPDNSRKDLKNLLTITIDGEDAKDFDDAISVEKIIKGYRLWVHIADVSEYVKTGGVIDREALERATSVYFPGSVFPMLPESISNGVCSLRPNEEKLTVTVRMDIDRSGKVIDKDFMLSTIRSYYRMTYTDVTKILNGDKELREKYQKIVTMLEDARELAEIIEKKRNDIGAINFVTRESKITLDEKGEVIDIRPYPYEVSNGIIEQFMIMANETVAEFTDNKNMPSIYRVHEAPSEMKLDAFKEFVKGFGYDFDTSDVSPKKFSDLLNAIKGEPYESIVSKIMLRSMMKAKYTTENSGHFGLSLDYYCHFTSPIRRYPDLMVHRMLKAIIQNKADEKFISKMKKLTDNAAVQSTEREVAAEKAERDIDDYYKAVYMTKHVGERYDGIVSGVLSSGIFVALENTVEGFVPIIDLPNDRYDLDEKKYRLNGIKYQFAIGDKVQVEIKSSIVETRNVNMMIISESENHLRKRKKGAKIKQ